MVEDGKHAARGQAYPEQIKIVGAHPQHDMNGAQNSFQPDFDGKGLGSSARDRGGKGND